MIPSIDSMRGFTMAIAMAALQWAIAAEPHATQPDALDAKLAKFFVMQYTTEVPQAGNYKLTAKVATSNVNHSPQPAVNGSETPIHISLPFTIEMWGESEPVTVTFNQGANTLRFWRDQATQYGVAVKAFTLKPSGAK